MVPVALRLREPVREAVLERVEDGASVRLNVRLSDYVEAVSEMVPDTLRLRVGLSDCEVVRELEELSVSETVLD
eukprot:gene9169-biopygen15033